MEPITLEECYDRSLKYIEKLKKDNTEKSEERKRRQSDEMPEVKRKRLKSDPTKAEVVKSDMKIKEGVKKVSEHVEKGNLSPSVLSNGHKELHSPKPNKVFSNAVNSRGGYFYISKRRLKKNMVELGNSINGGMAEHENLKE